MFVFTNPQHAPSHSAMQFAIKWIRAEQLKQLIKYYVAEVENWKNVCSQNVLLIHLL